MDEGLKQSAKDIYEVIASALSDWDVALRIQKEPGIGIADINLDRHMECVSRALEALDEAYWRMAALERITGAVKTSGQYAPCAQIQEPDAEVPGITTEQQAVGFIPALSPVFVQHHTEGAD